jgi:hypothetical protein
MVLLVVCSVFSPVYSIFLPGHIARCSYPVSAHKKNPPSGKTAFVRKNQRKLTLEKCTCEKYFRGRTKLHQNFIPKK